MTRIIFTLSLAVLLPSCAYSQESRPGRTARSAPARDVVARLRAEASRVDAKRTSRVFADLSGGPLATRLGLSREQRDLIGELGELTVDIVRFWLLRIWMRALGRTTPNWKNGFLSEEVQGAEIVAHAEAMLLEGVLDTPQLVRVPER